MSSTTLVSSKRSAGAAGMEVSTEGSKRRRLRGGPRKPMGLHKAQNGIYAAEKLSDSFSVSHVVNLLIRSECTIHTY
jgi:hypothetical protein